MMGRDIFAFSLLNLKRRRERALLTVLGIALGASLIVLMVALGLGASAATEIMLREWGDLTLITVTDRNGTHLTDQWFQTLRENPDILAATPVTHFTEVGGEITVEGKEQFTAPLLNITGIELSAMEAMGYSLTEGTFQKATSTDSIIPVFVTEDFAYEFSDIRKAPDAPGRTRKQSVGEPPFFDLSRETLNLSLTVGAENEDKPETETYRLLPLGTLRKESSSGQTAFGVYMDTADLKRLQEQTLYKTKASIHTESSEERATAYVKIKSLEKVDAIEEQFEKEGLEVSSLNQIRKRMETQIARDQLLLLSIAAVSLLVAAMNILNTMSTAVLERNREIGIMKVLGCGPKSIGRFFITESGILGLLGGTVGSLVGACLASLINRLPKWAASGNATAIALLSAISSDAGTSSSPLPLTVIPWWLIIATVLFTTIIAILSGSFPARKAARLSAQEAIRRE